MPIGKGLHALGVQSPIPGERPREVDLPDSTDKTPIRLRKAYIAVNIREEERVLPQGAEGSGAPKWHLVALGPKSGGVDGN